MKGGLDQAALLQPRPTIVGQETFSKDETEHMIVRDILVVVAVILLEDVAHPVRVKDQRERTDERRNRDDISIALAHLQQEVERMAQKAERILGRGRPWRSGRAGLTLLALQKTRLSRKR
jgi:hypothetical protein